jgi:hypothetical protein
MKPLTSHEGLQCANCGVLMQGEFCQACGQSIHSVVRPMHHMVEDTLDMVFHVDGRIVHTLPPLLYRPGFLTMEYLAGRRQRYVAPFRLMFVLCLLAFFVCHLAVDHFISIDTTASAGTGDFAKDPSAEAVRAHYEQMRKDFDTPPADSKPRANAPRKRLSTEFDHANHRLAQLGAAPLENPAIDSGNFKPEQVHLSWLTEGMNASLNRSIGKGMANLSEMSNDGEAGAEARERLFAGMFAVLPQTMFILIPAFALLLKLVYLFQRRLYMEHLIVALHGHAFVFLAVLLGMPLVLLRGWLLPHAAWTATLLQLLSWALLLWVPIYLLIMQKRVYRQGWLMTTVKYLFVGWCYTFLLGYALVFAALLGFTH